MYVRNIKKLFPARTKKTNTTPQLYGKYVRTKTISHQKHKNWHNTTTVLYSKYISM